MVDARERPIGVFDSGFGGLTVMRSLIDLMPNESLVYIGDTGRYPYGNKPAYEVRGYAIELANSLVHDHGAKMIVVACNTAASVALDALSESLT
ncbi:MAG: glutamate racemase, partial [Actinomycetota bacterium]